jgi:DNA-binding response OmpR family regulator
MSKVKIVIIEDEPDIIEVMSYNLKREGFLVSSSRRGDEGLSLVRKQSPALVLLDLMLPGTDGLSVCQQLKADPMTREIPIIMVSAKGEESDVVIGLGLGADDYIAKPFSPRELLARVKAVLRRSLLQQDQQKEQQKSRLQIDELTIDALRHEVAISGEPIKLTATEFKLLYQLAAQPGRAFSREQLLNRVIGDGVVVVDRNIDVHVRSVRKKLGDYSRMIETIRGVGYRFHPS